MIKIGQCSTKLFKQKIKVTRFLRHSVIKFSLNRSRWSVSNYVSAERSFVLE